MTTPQSAAAPAGTVGAVVRLIEVSAEDIRIVTDAVLDNWLKHWTSGGGHEYCECRYCGEDQDYNWDKHSVVKEHHKLDCAVLVARSIQPNNAVRVK